LKYPSEKLGDIFKLIIFSWLSVSGPYGQNC
jgi:hypothetical protein